MDTINALIRHYNMKPLAVEGGTYIQTYAAAQRLPAGIFGHTEEKPASTAILYLLTADTDSFSALHRLPTDEVYHFYLGDPVTLLLLYPNGHSQQVTLGHDVLNGQHVQFVVPAGVWQGSCVQPGGTFALMGTTMAPGYTDTDYTGGERDALIAEYPKEAALISQLTRPDAPTHIEHAPDA